MGSNSLLLAAAALAASAHAASTTKVHVVRDLQAPRGIRVVRNADAAIGSKQDVLAWAQYKNTVNETGWGLLEVYGNNSFANIDVAYAAGYAEGVAMAKTDDGYNVIYDHIMNTGAEYDLGSKLDAWLQTNRLWVQGMVAQNPTDPYWHQVDLVFRQLDGVYAGYSDTAPPEQQLLENTFVNVNLAGDLFDLEPAVGGSKRNLRAGKKSSPYDWVRGSHCSALFKLLPGSSDILAAHTTWSSFESMMRTYKVYNLPYTMTSDPSSPTVPAVTSMFSSYPASLFSTDDHYVTSAGMVIIETTIGNNNNTLYQDYVKPETVLEFMRNVVSNRLGSSGPAWVGNFSQYNSGTYNNEWMVLDTKLFTPGQALVPNTFWVLDQMPGNIAAADMSGLLQSQGYFSSFNVPFFPSIFNVSGQWALVEQYGGVTGAGAYFSWNYTVRHNIFARDAPGVTDMDGMKKIMRYNDFQNDPLSTQGCGSNPPYTAIGAISARCDLNPATGDWLIPGIGQEDLAGIDTKIASALNIQAGTLSVWAQSGPTHDQQPPFSWTNTSINKPHAGLPETFNFDWVQLTYPADF